jgi:hypothetical protein
LTVDAKEEIDKATLVLDSGWTEQMQINTIEPSPVGEASRQGRLALDFGHLGPGDKLVVYLQFQVNPTKRGPPFAGRRAVRRCVPPGRDRPNRDGLSLVR